MVSRESAAPEACPLPPFRYLSRAILAADDLVPSALMSRPLEVRASAVVNSNWLGFSSPPPY